MQKMSDLNNKTKIQSDEMTYSAEEKMLMERLEKINKLKAELDEKESAIALQEKNVKAKEKALKENEKAKKQVLLRLAPSLWEDLAAWAEDDFRSINGQIEFLLSECVKNRKNKK